MKFKKIIKFIFTFFLIFSLGFAAAEFKGMFFKKNHKKASNSNQNKEKTLYTCSMHPFIIEEQPGTCPICAMDLVKKEAETGNKKKEREIAYWKSPTNRSKIYDKPGNSQTGEDLVPVYEDELIGGVEILIDPVVIHNMGIKTSKVKQEDLLHSIRTYGHITYDETKILEVSPRFSGWIEEIYVNFNGEYVKKGAPLFRVYSPELITGQEEYLAALKNRSMQGSSMEKSASRKLINYGLLDDFLKRLKKEKKAKDSILIKAPSSGIILDKNILKGGFFSPGKSLMKICDISNVWVKAHIFDREIEIVKKGMEAQMILPASGDKKFIGKVSYIYPFIEKKTRDLIVRIDFENKDMSLKPDMFADIVIKTELGKGIVVPNEAIIRSGIKNIIFVSKGNGRFIPRNVETGQSVNNDKVEILSGIAPGEEVVVSGQFMLDSESRLNEAVNKMIMDETKNESKDLEDDFFSDM